MMHALITEQTPGSAVIQLLTFMSAWVMHENNPQKEGEKKRKSTTAQSKDVEFDKLPATILSKC